MKRLFSCVVAVFAAFLVVSCEFEVLGFRFDLRVDTGTDLHWVRFYALEDSGRYKEILKVPDLRMGQKLSSASMPSDSRIPEVGLVKNSPNAFYRSNDICVFNGKWNTEPDGSGSEFTELAICDIPIEGSLCFYAQYEVKGRKRGNGSASMIGEFGQIEDGCAYYLLKRTVEDEDEDLPEGIEPEKHDEYALFMARSVHAADGCLFGSDGFVRPDGEGPISFECGLFEYNPETNSVIWDGVPLVCGSPLQVVYGFDADENLVQIVFYGNDEWSANIPLTRGVLYEFRNGSGGIDALHIVYDCRNKKYAMLSLDGAGEGFVWYRDGFVSESEGVVSFPNNDDEGLEITDFTIADGSVSHGSDVFMLDGKYNVTLMMSDDRKELLSLKRRGVTTGLLTCEDVVLHHIPDADPLCGELYIIEMAGGNYAIINPGNGSISNIGTEYVPLGVIRTPSSGGKVIFDENTSFGTTDGKFTFWGKSTFEDGTQDAVLYRTVPDGKFAVVKFGVDLAARRWVFVYL